MINSEITQKLSIKRYRDGHRSVTLQFVDSEGEDYALAGTWSLLLGLGPVVTIDGTVSEGNILTFTISPENAALLPNAYYDYRIRAVISGVTFYPFAGVFSFANGAGSVASLENFVLQVSEIL